MAPPSMVQHVLPSLQVLLAEEMSGMLMMMQQLLARHQPMPMPQLFRAIVSLLPLLREVLLLPLLLLAPPQRHSHFHPNLPRSRR